MMSQVKRNFIFCVLTFLILILYFLHVRAIILKYKLSRSLYIKCKKTLETLEHSKSEDIQSEENINSIVLDSKTKHILFDSRKNTNIGAEEDIKELLKRMKEYDNINCSHEFDDYIRTIYAHKIENEKYIVLMFVYV